jgi:hypothetical protein
MAENTVKVDKLFSIKMTDPKFPTICVERASYLLWLTNLNA